MMKTLTQLPHFDINHHPLLIISTNNRHPTHLHCCSGTNRQLLKSPVVALTRSRAVSCKPRLRARQVLAAAGEIPLPPLDLTEDNIRQVLEEARVELAQLFDTSVGITGEVELADLDGPFVKLSLRGRFWHKRSTVLARIGNYLKLRIPEILEVEIEDEKQLDDSPENF